MKKLIGVILLTAAAAGSVICWARSRPDPVVQRLQALATTWRGGGMASGLIWASDAIKLEDKKPIVIPGGDANDTRMPTSRLQEVWNATATQLAPYAAGAFGSTLAFNTRTGILLMVLPAHIYDESKGFDWVIRTWTFRRKLTFLGRSYWETLPSSGTASLEIIANLDGGFTLRLVTATSNRFDYEILDHNNAIVARFHVDIKSDGSPDINVSGTFAHITGLFPRLQVLLSHDAVVATAP